MAPNSTSKIAGLGCAVLLLLAAGCGSRMDDRVAADFSAERPDATLLRVAIGEGDFDNVYCDAPIAKIG